MSDDLPVRRRRRASRYVPEQAADAQEGPPPSQGGDLITAEQAAEAREADALATGRRFVRPEERFSAWHTIVEEVQREFVERSKGRPGGIAETREEENYYNLVNDVVNRHPDWNISPVELPELVKLLRAHQFGYGLLEDYMTIPDLEEVYFNRYDQGFYIANGTKHRINEPIFRSNDDMLAFLERVANENGLEINLKSPILDAAMRDGSRLNATIEPISVDGPDIIIRKHRDIPFTVETLIDQGYLTAELAEDIKRWVRGGMNLIVSGATGSGKTSFLNAIGKAYLPKTDRVLVLENRKELQIETLDCKYFQTREDPTKPGDDDITLEVLVRAMLRKRPRRIIVGEVRGPEAYWALSAWNTGHEGSMCTIHASSAPAAINRLETLASSAGQLKGEELQSLIADAVDIVVQVELDPYTGQRRVREVIEVLHPHKYSQLDPEVLEQVKRLSDEQKIRALRGEIWILPLYQRDREGRLLRLSDIVPIEGRTGA